MQISRKIFITEVHRIQNARKKNIQSAPKCIEANTHTEDAQNVTYACFDFFIINFLILFYYNFCLILITFGIIRIL